MLVEYRMTRGLALVGNRMQHRLSVSKLAFSGFHFLSVQLTPFSFRIPEISQPHRNLQSMDVTIFSQFLTPTPPMSLFPPCPSQTSRPPEVIPDSQVHPLPSLALTRLLYTLGCITSSVKSARCASPRRPKRLRVAPEARSTHLH